MARKRKPSKRGRIEECTFTILMLATTLVLGIVLGIGIGCIRSLDSIDRMKSAEEALDLATEKMREMGEAIMELESQLEWERERGLEANERASELEDEAMRTAILLKESNERLKDATAKLKASRQIGRAHV